MDTPKAIVSSSHLASGQASEVSQLEYSLINVSKAFERWLAHCMDAAGAPNLSTIDSLVLHHVHHRDREKTLGGICLVLNIEDSHLVSYSLKKLRQLELVAARRRGKESVYRTTKQGSQICERYREVREYCLIDTLVTAGGVNIDELANIAVHLRALSGVYDQAARAATSL